MIVTHQPYQPYQSECPEALADAMSDRKLFY